MTKIAQPSPKVPLRLVLVLPFVFEVFAAVSLTGWISLHNGQKAVNDLASQLRTEVAARIQQKLTDHLENAPLVNQINVDAIALGTLNPDDHEATTRHIFKQLKQFPNLTGITIATEQPNYVGVVYDENGLKMVTLWDKVTGGVVDKLLAEQGRVVSALRDAEYDHRQRPWYLMVLEANRPVWQEPYVTINPRRFVISADHPIHDKRGNFIGLADAEISLTDISDFLRSLRIGKTGQTFIMERDGDLIATSTDQEAYYINPDSQQPERLKATQSNDLIIYETAKYLTQKFDNLSQIDRSQQLDFMVNGEHMFVQVMPFYDPKGLDWIVVVTVPESDFMETINTNTHTTIVLCLVALAIATGIGILTSRWLMLPILKTISAANALSSGDWHQRVPNSRVSEVDLLSGAFNRMANQLQESFGKLEYNAYHDSLTGLLNQTAFRKKLQGAIEHRIHSLNDRRLTDNPNYLFAVLFLDLDYFKLVNDSLGHLIGDELLIEVSQRLKHCIRSSDAIARFGGDEFIILLDHLTHKTDATQVAAKISRELQRPFKLSGNEVFISTSIGIVYSNISDNEPESFLRNADIALYRAKSNGKANYEVFDAEMHTETVGRLQLETDLRHAIEQKELEVYYQPIIDLETFETKGFEALVRWKHPARGMIAPAEFIPVAEETGLIVKLGWWVLRQACHQMHVWQQQFPACQFMTVSVNLSSKQFLQSDLFEQVERILEETRLLGTSLKLEITESILMNHSEAIRIKLKQLRILGIQLSIDDFGTGYSSLSYLHRFPINTLKIDRSFISLMGTQSENLGIVEAIIVLAHKMGMDVIAEGVETQEQSEYLHRMGCEQAQGYLFSAPVLAKDISQVLKTPLPCAALD
jgi:diguanylate cyclase (GGDEF)-like protein